MKLQPVVRIVAVSALVWADAMSDARNAAAQVIDFGQIDSFENLGTGTQRGGSPPKTIVDADCQGAPTTVRDLARAIDRKSVV